MASIIRLVVELNDDFDHCSTPYKLGENLAPSTSAQSFVVIVPNHLTISEVLNIIVRKHNELYPERPSLSEQGIYLRHASINTDIRDTSIRLFNIFDEWGKGVWSPRVKIVCKPDPYKSNDKSNATDAIFSCPLQPPQNFIASSVYDFTGTKSSQSCIASPGCIAIQNQDSQMPIQTQNKKSFCNSILSSSASSTLVREVRKHLKKKSIQKNSLSKAGTDFVTCKTSANYSSHRSLANSNEHPKRTPCHVDLQSPTKCVASQTKASPYMGNKRRRDETMLLQPYSDELDGQGVSYQASTTSKKFHVNDKKKKNEGSRRWLNEASHDSVTVSNENETKKEKKSSLEKNQLANKCMNSSDELANRPGTLPTTGKSQILSEDSHPAIRLQLKNSSATSSNAPNHIEDKKPANPIYLHDLLDDHRTHTEHQLFDDNKKKIDQGAHPIFGISAKSPVGKEDSHVVSSQLPDNGHINDAEIECPVKNEDQSTKKYTEITSQMPKQQEKNSAVHYTPISDHNCPSKKNEGKKNPELQNSDNIANSSDYSSSEDDSEEQSATFKKSYTGLHSNLTAHTQEKRRKNYKGAFSSLDPPGPFGRLKKTKNTINQTDQNTE